MNTKKTTKISKFLSLVLRHKPETIGIVLDEHGWADVDSLIEKSSAYGLDFDFETLRHVVDTNEKKRFAFNDSHSQIRASQGHSVQIELGYTNQQPPAILYHGTAERFVSSIKANGLDKRSRQHVHMSSDLETAKNVGQRHGKVFIFEICAREMFDDQFEFFLSDNGVWLTDHVPPKYLRDKV